MRHTSRFARKPQHTEVWQKHCLGRKDEEGGDGPRCQRGFGTVRGLKELLSCCLMGDKVDRGKKDRSDSRGAHWIGRLLLPLLAT